MRFERLSVSIISTILFVSCQSTVQWASIDTIKKNLDDAVHLRVAGAQTPIRDGTADAATGGGTQSGQTPTAVGVSTEPRVDTDPYRRRPVETRITRVPTPMLTAVRSNPFENLRELTDFLVQGIDDPFLRVKTIHDWVAENTAYDFSSFLSNNIPDQSFGSVLKRGKAVCQGYSQLFEQMATLAGFQTRVVTGYSRGYGSDLFIPENPYNSNHAWNAVLIGDHWYLIDCTWDSGYIDGGRFVRDYQTAYLFLPPRNMIYTHYPSDRSWQLMDQPITPEQFVDLPYYRGDYFSFGLEAIPGLSKVTKTGNEFQVSFPIPDAVSVGAFLVDGRDNIVARHTLVRSSKGRTNIRVLFPAAGDWTLRLFAKHSGTKVEKWTSDLGFIATEGTDQEFPLAFTPYFDRGCSVVSPVTEPLASDTPIEFRLSLPGYTVAFLKSGSRRIDFVRQPDSTVFSVTAALPPGTTATIYAGNARYGHFDGILKYTVGE